MNDIGELKDFFKSNLGGKIHKNNYNRIEFVFSKKTPQASCGVHFLFLSCNSFNFMRKVCHAYESAGIKIIGRESGFSGITVHFVSYLEIDLKYSFGQLLIWSIRDELDG